MANKKVKKIPLDRFIKEGIETTFSGPPNNLLKILRTYRGEMSSAKNKD